MTSIKNYQKARRKMKVKSDKRIRLMAIALMATELNSSEKQRSHRHDPLYLVARTSFWAKGSASMNLRNY